MIENKLLAFFDVYRKAFVDYDLTALAQCYHLPCVLHGPDTLVAIGNRPAFDDEFSAVFLQLQSANVNELHVDSASYDVISAQVVNVLVQWRFIDSSGEDYTQLVAFYQLCKIDDAFKISNVVSHMLEQPPKLSKVLPLVTC